MSLCREWIQITSFVWINRWPCWQITYFGDPWIIADRFFYHGTSSTEWLTDSWHPKYGLKVFLGVMDSLYIAIELVIAVLSIAGNVLVCWAVAINSTLKNATNYFLVSLAVADILVGCLAIPFAITISIGLDSDFYGCLFLACFVLVLTQSSIFSLLAVAVDRYLAVKIPLRWVFQIISISCSLKRCDSCYCVCVCVYIYIYIYIYIHTVSQLSWNKLWHLHARAA